MSLLKTPAITLKSRRWGEADRIVTFYTLRFGKLRGVARGARRPKSRFGSALEPFVHCELNLFEKRGDSLYRVTQADILETFGRFREDLSLMSGAARMTNLVAAITAEVDPGPRVFDTLLESLRALHTSSDSTLTVLLYQIKLLGLTGFRPETDHCAACTATFTQASDGMFSPTSGGLVCRACARRRPDRCLPMAAGSRAFLQQALRWAPDVVTRLKATGQVRSELEAAIDAYVTVVAGTRLPPVNFLVAESQPSVYSSRA
ncbi:MAG: DNA repair protein RecO [Nitrospiraceae bacterium]